MPTGPGQFSNFPLVEQTYFDMLSNGFGSPGDGARVGIALQQITIGLTFDLLGSRLTNRDRTAIQIIQVYATSRTFTLRQQVNVLG
jgi:hypothetical protein